MLTLTFEPKHAAAPMPLLAPEFDHARESLAILQDRDCEENGPSFAEN